MGRLIVFEGTDGSGKATQSKLLRERLLSEGVDCLPLTFPRYGEPSAAAVELYLSGKLGAKPGDVNAYAASTFYAVDRYCSYRQSWGGFYQRGGILIADRYTTSNAVHQASKLPPDERKAFLDWLFGFEYGLLGLPEPTAVFYLDVPTELSERMMRRREAATSTSADIHERDDAYLRACRAVGEQLVADYGWQYVDCSRSGRMRSIEDIHEEIYRRTSALLQRENA
ncbi:MAG: thymidylate kinase [Oscillospiraceae bacterium]|nr:thymidylate kinase [Oscillospiraceae bacterium]